MRNIIYITLILAFISCRNSSSTSEILAPAIAEVDSFNPFEKPIEEQKIEQIDSIDIDSTAIADIKFCISKIEFNSKKSKFLTSHPQLGNLKIASLTGYFYNDSLAGIEIISVQQNAFRNQSNEFIGWEDLIKKKYHGKYDFRTREYETSVKNIYVTDVSSQNNPSSDIKELFARKYQRLYFKRHLPDITFSNNVEGMMYTGEAFNSTTSKRAAQLYERMNREISDNTGNYYSSTTTIYQIYYEKIRNEANANIETHNNHIKNNPSWSIIRIVFKPLRDQYYNQIEQSKKHSKSEALKDADLI